MKKIFTLVRIVCLTLLAGLLMTGCGKHMLVYHVNKSSELQEYESELAEESLAEESLAEASREAEEAKAAEEKKTDENSFVKKEISRERTKVKGIYLTDSTAGSDRMEEIISHIDETELNAVVIDVKNDEGKLAIELNSETLQTLGESAKTIKDLPELVSTLHSHGIYVIARVVCFRDPHMAELRPDLMEQKEDGTLFYDHSGMSWVNPYKQEYWEYLDAVAEGCARAGFDEVQLDYVRFCTEKGMQSVAHKDADCGKTEIITRFVQYMSDRMAEYGIFMSTDVFGTIIDSYEDAEAVGQDYGEMSAAADYMCPMIYPSHYGDGNFGLAHPDLEPYQTIKSAMASSEKALKKAKADSTDASQAVVRPWLQGFTASYLEQHLEYGAEELQEQIRAVYDSGGEEWLIWNAANRYDWTAFKAAE